MKLIKIKKPFPNKQKRMYLVLSILNLIGMVLFAFGIYLVFHYWEYQLP